MSKARLGSASIVVLEAYEHVHAKNRNAYEAAGAAIDKLVEQVEPGMLVHVLTEVSAVDEVITYRWLEVFQNLARLREHLTSQHVAEHVASLGNGILAAPTDLVIYGNLSAAEQDALKQELGADRVRFASAVTSFYR